MLIAIFTWEASRDLNVVFRKAGADPGFCEGGFEGGFVDCLKGTFEHK